MELMPVLENDHDGVVRCLWCDWSRACRSMEEIEFFGSTHARESHNVAIASRLQFADDGQSARHVRVPPLD